jgi:hypothetical protein
MSELDVVLSYAQPSPFKPDEYLVSLSSSAQAEMIRAYVIDWFGADNDRQALRLVVDGTDYGVLSRVSARVLATTSDRGGYGSGDYFLTPGSSPDYKTLVLTCPYAGCQVRGAALFYDEDHPPRCPIHDEPLSVTKG